MLSPSRRRTRTNAISGSGREKIRAQKSVWKKPKPIRSDLQEASPVSLLSVTRCRANLFRVLSKVDPTIIRCSPERSRESVGRF